MLCECLYIYFEFSVTYTYKLDHVKADLKEQIEQKKRCLEVDGVSPMFEIPVQRMCQKC